MLNLELHRAQAGFGCAVLGLGMEGFYGVLGGQLESNYSHHSVQWMYETGTSVTLCGI